VHPPALSEYKPLHAQPQRVPLKEPLTVAHKEDHAQLPRVKMKPPLPASSMQHHSKQLKNARYHNSTPHSYPLRSRTRQ
jgi:hypothetical protein